MIDLHTHVLPGLDDGAPDAAAAVALASAAAAEGVTVLAATPHLRADHPDVRPSELAGRVAALREELAREDVAVDIVEGGEVDLHWAADADDEDLRLASYGQRGHDVLVETPYGELPPAFDDLLFRVQARGFRALLAHPERSPTFQRDPRRLSALVERGALVQVTAAALADGSRRSRSHRLATALVREGLAHVIASDAHGVGGIRPAGLTAGVRAAERLAPGRGRWMVTDAPAAILAGDPLPPAPPPRPPKGLARLLRPRLH